MKKLRPGEVRFTVRPHRTGPRSTVWEVYDRARGSIPAQTTELGRVKQCHSTEELAQAEADRLNREHPV